MAENYEPTFRSRLSLAMFRKNVHTLRIKLVFSKSYMARKSGMTFNSYTDFEEGDTFPKGDNLVAIAYALGCTPEQLSIGFIDL